MTHSLKYPEEGNFFFFFFYLKTILFLSQNFAAKIHNNTSHISSSEEENSTKKTGCKKWSQTDRLYSAITQLQQIHSQEIERYQMNNNGN